MSPIEDPSKLVCLTGSAPVWLKKDNWAKLPLTHVAEEVHAKEHMDWEFECSSQYLTSKNYGRGRWEEYIKFERQCHLQLFIMSGQYSAVQ